MTVDDPDHKYQHICMYMGHETTTHQRKRGWHTACLVSDGPHVHTTFKNNDHSRVWFVDKQKHTICNRNEECLRYNIKQDRIDVAPLTHVPTGYHLHDMHKHRHHLNSNMFWDIEEKADDDKDPTSTICLMPNRDICLGLMLPKNRSFHMHGSDQSLFIPDIHRRHPWNVYDLPQWILD